MLLLHCSCSVLGLGVKRWNNFCKAKPLIRETKRYVQQCACMGHICLLEVKCTLCRVCANCPIATKEVQCFAIYSNVQKFGVLLECKRWDSTEFLILVNSFKGKDFFVWNRALRVCLIWLLSWKYLQFLFSSMVTEKIVLCVERQFGCQRQSCTTKFSGK